MVRPCPRRQGVARPENRRASTAVRRRANMGWWPIDPKTGESVPDARSKLSTDDFVLLNAVPGVDDDEAAHYLGDGPLDMTYSGADALKGLLGEGVRLRPEEVRRLLLQRAVPAALAGRGSRFAADLLRLVDEVWADIDWCYEEDWGRPARPAERAVLAEDMVERLTADSE